MMNKGNDYLLNHPEVMNQFSKKLLSLMLKFDNDNNSGCLKCHCWEKGRKKKKKQKKNIQTQDSYC